MSLSSSHCSYEIDPETGLHVLQKDKSAVLRWTHLQRVLVCVLYRWYIVKPRDIELLFDQIFDEEITAANVLPRPFAERKINFRWRSIISFKRCPYNEIYQVPFAELVTFSHIVHRLEKQASLLGIDLVLRSNERPEDFERFQKLRRHMKKLGTAGSSIHQTLTPVCPQQPTVKSIRTTEPTQNLTLRSTMVVSNSSAHKRLVIRKEAVAKQNCRFLTDEDFPQLLFRAWGPSSQGINSANGISSERFKTSPARLSRSFPSDSDPEFWKDCSKHFNIKKFISPFVSLTSSLIWAIHRALKLGRGASIAVIDGHSLANSQKIRFVPPILKTLADKGYYGHGYEGWFEYIAYGAIDGSCIIGCLDVDLLRSQCVEDPDMDTVVQSSTLSLRMAMRRCRAELSTDFTRESLGWAVGRLARMIKADIEIHQPWLEKFITVFVRDWNINVENLSPDDILDLRRGFLRAICDHKRYDEQHVAAQTLVTPVYSTTPPPQCSRQSPLAQTRQHRQVHVDQLPYRERNLDDEKREDVGYHIRCVLSDWKSESTPLLAEDHEDDGSDDTTESLAFCGLPCILFNPYA